MGKEIEPADIPVFGCMVSFCFGVVAWAYIFWARILPNSDSAGQKFAVGYPLLLLIAASVLLALFGIGLLPYAFFSKTRGPLWLVLLKCGFYLLPALTLVGSLWGMVR